MFRARQITVKDGKVVLDPLDYFTRHEPSERESESEVESSSATNMQSLPPETGLEESELSMTAASRMKEFPASSREKCETVLDWLKSLDVHLLRLEDDGTVVYRDSTLPGANIRDIIASLVQSSGCALGESYVISLLQNAPPEVRALLHRNKRVQKRSKRRISKVKVRVEDEETVGRRGESSKKRLVAPSAMEGVVEEPALENARHPIDEIPIKKSVTKEKAWYCLV